MKPLFFLASLMAAAFCCLPGTARGAQANAPAAGTPFDLQGYIDKEIRAGSKRIVVPPGRYRVTPKNQQHLALRGLKDVQIIADGVEMICTETTRALTVSRCTNVTVRGLVIDYDPLPFTQGRITGFSAGKSIHEIELFEGYPPAEAARNFKYEIFRPDTRTLRCEDRYLQKVEVVDSRHLRLTHPGGRAGDPEQVGDLVVIGAEHTPHGNAGHAIECSHNVNVRLENIDLFASNCFGFLEYNCDGSVYQRCRIDRRSPESDPVKRADPRLRSLDADAYHSKHAVKGPSYLECVARFMGDDCVNICGDYHLIAGSQGRELRVLAKHDMNIQPGDSVELVCYDGRRLPDAKAVAIQPAGAIRDEERAFLLKQRMNESLRTARGALNKAYTITLDREADIAMGGVICSASRIGNGFAVKGCAFGFNRSRGILIKASRGEVSGNRMEGCEMSAILVAPEYWWLEAGSSSDLKITGNTITACKGIPICVDATAGNGEIGPAGAHRNLVITGNTVQNCPMPGIVVCATRGLEIGNNTLELNDTRKSLPGFLRKAGVKELQPVVKINCAH
jgi:parallel beta-helix repeat protein